MALSGAGWLLLLGAEAMATPFICGVGWMGEANLRAFVAMHGASGLLTTHVPMLLAMMAPFLYAPLASIADRVFPEKRLSTMAAFVLGYASCWLVFGALLTVAHVLILAEAGDWRRAAAAVAGLWILWHGLPWRQRLLNLCHLEAPVSGSGLAPEAAALKQGLRTAAFCAATCAPPMLFAMSCGPYAFAATVCVTAFLWMERLLPPMRPGWGWENHRRTASALAHMARRGLGPSPRTRS